MCDITERTVKAHLSHVFEKMGVKDRVSLVIRITSKNPFTHSA
jgi:DNA-binding NarL/FixJ family response regulator